MNVFVLHLDPVLCAQMHADQHVGKMLLEACQLLCGAHPEPADRALWLGMLPEDRLREALLPYSHTHRNHPCASWTRQRAGNYGWLVQLGFALADEWRHRNRREHASRAVVEWCAARAGQVAFAEAGAHRSPFALAMPEEYWHSDAVVAYRAYYAAEKRVLRGKPASWTGRPVPEWFLR